jgi:hypothetical protein
MRILICNSSHFNNTCSDELVKSFVEEGILHQSLLACNWVFLKVLKELLNARVTHEQLDLRVGLGMADSLLIIIILASAAIGTHLDGLHGLELGLLDLFVIGI